MLKSYQKYVKLLGSLTNPSILADVSTPQLPNLNQILTPLRITLTIADQHEPIGNRYLCELSLYLKTSLFKKQCNGE